MPLPLTTLPWADQMIKTAQNIIAAPVAYPSSVTEAACDFIDACLSKVAGARPDMHTLLSMRWMSIHQVRVNSCPLAPPSPTLPIHFVSTASTQAHSVCWREQYRHMACIAVLLLRSQQGYAPLLEA
jgi:hypothetical protein